MILTERMRAFVAANKIMGKCKKRGDPQGIADTRRVALSQVQNVQSCVHLGKALVNQTCGCKQKVRECAIHEQCTWGPVVGKQCCQGCSDYELHTDTYYGDSRRHLLYFIYPVATNDAWRWNVQRLKPHIDLFNGRRIIAVCNTPARKRHRLDPVEVVKEMLGERVEYIQVSQRGAGKLGEVTAFKRLLELVKPWSEDRDYTFYGHAKGVLSSAKSPLTLKWAEHMYRECLDHWSNVETQLKTYPITGCFRKLSHPYFPWHYSGTFYWFRNKDAFARRWDDIPQRYGGTEMWPSQLFTHAESGCLFGDNIGSLYHPDTHRGLESLPANLHAVDDSPPVGS